MREIKMYTDGACSGNPGPGGWGVVLMYQDQIKEAHGAVGPETTNNRMELQAAVNGLSLLKESCKVTIYSDSAYMVDAFNKNWIDTWRVNGWLTSKKKPVDNKDLWERLVELARNYHDTTFVKVKGHSDDEWNNRADVLATEAIRRAKV